MPVTTTSAAVHITPVVIKTFLDHGKRKAKRFKEGKREDETPQDDIFFDEAFHIVKAFIELGTKNTIESLQAFTNTHVPAPYWTAVSPVCIPLTCCNRAADVLIDWFGPEELKHVVGGERWWQVRGLDGVDGEWITQKNLLDNTTPITSQNIPESDQNILRMEKLNTVMLYVHGGGYFWGSINTHRYQLIRYARKIKGRVFAVNYRKAPQYPWPCPLQDIIAAYLYLIQPPPGALHKPISPSKIVFAGDSAGGGLCVATLTVLRDMGMPMPAGAVLISPWVDLTHSFPSVMQNTVTDIIPEHGFLAKPSTLWPVDPIPLDGGRVIPTKSNPPPEPGHSDMLKPSHSRIELEKEGEAGTPPPGEKVKTQEEMLDKDWIPSRSEDNEKASPSNLKDNQDDEYDVDTWEPRPPKVLMENPNAVPLELRSQIQQYAMTEQLTHPLVSPILQGSLGNLPPLYIIAGDGEVLRDEIIYLAHRAAHPAEYPARVGVLRDGRRQKENAEKFTVPTKVHLQVFDGMCHVLTVFSFTENSKYAYRSIAEFVKHVSQNNEEHLARNPFPELHRPPSVLSADSDSDEEGCNHKLSKEKEKNASNSEQAHTLSKEDTPGIALFKHNEKVIAEELKHNETEEMPRSLREGSQSPKAEEGQEKDIPDIRMICERVDIYGKARPMEPREELQALQLKPGQIGMIKEAPTLRWLKGQEIWDKRYRRRGERILRQREKLEAKAKRIISNALDQGLIHESQGRVTKTRSSAASTHSRKSSMGSIQQDRRWGPLDLEDEKPPPSAIANRRDTPEALALLTKSIYHTAPITHYTVPKLKVIDAIRAAFDPKDDPNKPPQQSVSEQQVHAHIIPIHGLRMWDGILKYFGRKTTAKAASGRKQAADAIRTAGEVIGVASNNSSKRTDSQGTDTYLPGGSIRTGD
ncbi:lipase/esterase [Crucibulum laeve]|uniref:Lipase/esterase n=1 Tax=Crucibulum laeve TaxID=68775 RepID=A0A5C3MGE4_9AGAR|nr:lipase/esterase [Crucibulum laeve]